MENYFVLNKETGRLELHFARSTYADLSASDKAEVNRVCLFAKSIPAWVSRTSTGTPWQAEALAKRLGLTDAGTKGERLAFADKLDEQAQRAEARAERMEDRAERAHAEAASRHGAADRIASFIPPGQPILVGHHSEKRHRKDLERIDNHMRGAFEASDRAKHYERRAEAARETAAQDNLDSKPFLARRVAEQEAEERDLLRRIDEATAKQAAEWLARLQESLAAVQDKLTYYRQRLDALGGITYSRENVKVGDRVVCRHGWSTVIKTNPKTVEVRHEAPGIVGMTGTYPYAEIRQHQAAPEGSAPVATPTRRRSARQVKDEEVVAALVAISKPAHGGTLTGLEVLSYVMRACKVTPDTARELIRRVETAGLVRREGGLFVRSTPTT